MRALSFAPLKRYVDWGCSGGWLRFALFIWSWQVPLYGFIAWSIWRHR